jgi:IPT/TIG domain
MTTSSAVRSFNVAYQENRMMSSALARGRARVLGALTLLVGALVLSAGAGQAHAASTYPLLSSFGSFAGPQAVAVNQATGSVLVLEQYTGQVKQFDASGTPRAFTAPELSGATALDGANTPAGALNFSSQADLAVDNSGTSSQGNIYVFSAAQATLFAFDASGHYLYDVNNGLACGVGVAPDGHFWLGLNYDFHVAQYNSAGTPTGVSIFSLGADYSGAPACGSAFDAAGNAYLINSPGGLSPVNKFDASGAKLHGAFDANASYDVAVDASTGAVFVDEGTGIALYDAAGVRQGASGVGQLTSSTGVAFNAASGLLYATDTSAGTVSIFGPALETGQATDISTTSAKLHGVVNPAGVATSYRFEYGTRSSYGSVAPATPVDIGSGAGDVPVSADISGLKPQTTYHFRVDLIRNGQVSPGPDVTFKTVGPVATFGTISGLTPTAATLSGTVDARGLSGGTYHFAVKASDSTYAGTTQELAIPEGTGSVPVSATITGLPAGSTFTAGLVISAGGGLGSSDLVDFQTPDLAPFIPVAPPGVAANPYGCGAPRLNAINTHPRAGDTVSVTGSDLGVGGSLAVGGFRVTPTSWSSTAFTFAVPDGAAGAVPVTVNCGTASNTVGLTVVGAVDNHFTITRSSVKGTTATLSVSVPGPGRIATAAGKTAGSKTTVKKAGTAKVAVRLSAAGKRALADAKSKRLTVTVRVTYTPVGGAARTVTKAVTFTRAGAR